MPPTTFPGRLRSLREQPGYTLEELGALCGWTKARVHALEQPSARPRKETVAALARALGCAITDLEPSYQIEVPEGVVVLRPDPDQEGVYWPWREEDRARVGELINHTELPSLALLLRAHGLGLCLLP